MANRVFPSEEDFEDPEVDSSFEEEEEEDEGDTPE